LELFLMFKPLKIAEVRQHTGRRMTVDEAATFVSPGQARQITRNQACALSLFITLRGEIA
jgi:hypothetical protein